MKATPPSPAVSAHEPAQLPPVVLVHGIFRNQRDMRRLRKTLEAAGRRTFAPSLKPCDGSAPLHELAAQLAIFIGENLAPGERCDLVGHSMGGMVARAYVQRHGGRDRVRRLVTLAAPHHGSLLAWCWPGRGARDLRPGSPFLRDLARDVHHLEGVLVASVWTPFDLVILPARSSELPVGRNVRFPLPHHRSLITSRRLARALVKMLDTDPLPEAKT
ncbi:MAG: alpha/beta fold hydrolase [Opitutales bacterium]|jgi:triacylglycerol lipase